jgi:hypothetical protein
VDGLAIIRGEVASIQWAYYRAAAIDRYTVTGYGPKGARRWALSARVLIADAFKMTQRPLMFVAPHAHGVWRWPIVTLTREGDQLRAELGPVEDHVTLRAT